MKEWMNERVSLFPIDCPLFVQHSMSMSHGQCDRSLFPGGRAKGQWPGDENGTFT